jgi:SAM-dependent methyltransferase
LPLGLSFGAVAAAYDRARPPYPARVLDRVQRALELPPTARIAELGAGTGRLTRPLTERFSLVVAIEPDARMLTYIHDAALIEAAAEGIPLRDRSIDSTFVGDAFHWFDAPRVIAEVARILVPRGALAVISSWWWDTEPPLPKHAADLLAVPYRRFERERRPPWDEAFEDSPFERLRREVFQDQTTLDVDALLQLFSTTSSLASLQEGERMRLLEAVRIELPPRAYVLPIRHELAWTRLI